MEQILVLTLFQCIVSDLFTKASKIFDSGTNHFLAKTPFTGCHTDSFNSKLSDQNQTLEMNLNISSNFFHANETNTCLTLFQCIVGDFFTRAFKNFDTGGNHFVLKMPFAGCRTDSFYSKLTE